MQQCKYLYFRDYDTNSGFCHGVLKFLVIVSNEDLKKSVLKTPA
jgi:hypothetical protein